MLLDNVVKFCNQMYSSYGDKCGREKEGCNHPSGACSGSCYNCLRQVHYPNDQDGKMLYDCPKMLYHYVCQYSYLYTSELVCAFEYKWDFIERYSYYCVLSLGCGGCADLMALEYLRDKKATFPIAYMGIDVNNLWNPIHSYINNYCTVNGISYKIVYADIFEFFKQYEVPKINIIVIGYLISYLYNTGQIKNIDLLVDYLLNFGGYYWLNLSIYYWLDFFVNYWLYLFCYYWLNILSYYGLNILVNYLLDFFVHNG